jgi:hypothetical protein
MLYPISTNFRTEICYILGSAKKNDKLRFWSLWIVDWKLILSFREILSFLLSSKYNLFCSKKLHDDRVQHWQRLGIFLKKIKPKFKILKSQRRKTQNGLYMDVCITWCSARGIFLSCGKIPLHTVQFNRNTCSLLITPLFWSNFIIFMTYNSYVFDQTNG